MIKFRVICLAALVLVGCNQPDQQIVLDDEAKPALATEPAASPPPQASSETRSWVKERDGLRVTKNGFESRKLTWPLTVDTALIGCEHPELLWVEADGERYGINGMGQIHLKLERFDDVWMFDDEAAAATGVTEARVTPTDLMNETRKLCD